jgi:ABC-type multidrug transport system permease subunit
MPLTYINDGLRDAMIHLAPAQAFNNMTIALALAAFFIVLGSLLMNWKEE